MLWKRSIYRFDPEVVKTKFGNTGEVVSSGYFVRKLRTVIALGNPVAKHSHRYYFMRWWNKNCPPLWRQLESSIGVSKSCDDNNKYMLQLFLWIILHFYLLLQPLCPKQITVKIVFISHKLFWINILSKTETLLNKSSYRIDLLKTASLLNKNDIVKI